MGTLGLIAKHVRNHAAPNAATTAAILSALLATSTALAFSLATVAADVIGVDVEHEDDYARTGSEKNNNKKKPK